MPTRSETKRAPQEAQSKEWAAHSGGAKHSVFGNYQPVPTVATRADAPRKQSVASNYPSAETLQGAIDVAMARSFLYRFLAESYQDPAPDNWGRLADANSREMLGAAIRTLAANTQPLAQTAATLSAKLRPDLFDSFQEAYLAAFGHAARGRCPLNEIEYGDIKADPLFQPHRLADLAAFYRAFGLEVAEHADERHDHICLELEFMCVLAAKEAYALEHQLDAEAVSLCRNAQQRFLREHLGRWTPAFARRLVRTVVDNPLGDLANFTRAFIETECARFGVTPGSDDLLLRPVNEAAESMCHSCGVSGAPLGASA